MIGLFEQGGQNDSHAISLSFLFLYFFFFLFPYSPFSCEDLRLGGDPESFLKKDHFMISKTKGFPLSSSRTINLDVSSLET